MVNLRTIMHATGGGVAAYAAWLFSVSTLTTAPKLAATAGSLAALGALVAGAVSFLALRPASDPKRVFCGACLGAIIAVVGGMLAESAVGSARLDGVAGSLVRVVWDFFVAATLAAMISLAIRRDGPPKAIVAAAVASGTSLLLRTLCLVFLDSPTFAGVFGGAIAVESFAQAIGLGLGVGLSLGLTEFVERPATLWLETGLNEGESYPLRSTSTRIGMLEEVEIPIRGDANVAPVHAYVTRHKGGYWLMDAGTANGVFVNGERVFRHELKEGDRVDIGLSTFVFQSGEGSVPVARARRDRYTPRVYTLNERASYEKYRVPRLVDIFGREIQLGFGMTVLGREPDVPISVPYDATVSRKHAMLTLDGATVRVKDLGSRNGTYVNGYRLFDETPIRDGDEIYFGRTRMVFRL
jgi:pSer/pThr/pTyr-binding forkhead associated (FHA) protein